MRKDTLRKMALALPDATEQETWGQPTFRVRKRIFVMFSDEEREAWVKGTHDEQRALVQMDPETFFVPPYVGPSGWIGVRFRTVDREEMRELVTEAWRLTAPKRAVANFDEEA
ncbi:MAG TPA: MmcQ/YjbR family DNA-binding protein [Actinomycetota bacterium]|nr:MmcQ/YjbR family DNA-binding protein [Actinomycetota bacterium]